MSKEYTSLKDQKRRFIELLCKTLPTILEERQSNYIEEYLKEIKSLENRLRKLEGKDERKEKQNR